MYKYILGLFLLVLVSCGIETNNQREEYGHIPDLATREQLDRIEEKLDYLLVYEGVEYD